jgi:SpoIID/LytB domain protein
MFIMKKINRIDLFRLITGILIISALIIGVSAEINSQSRINRVKILILSKHIRMLKEGNTDSLLMTIPKTGELDTGKRRIPVKTLTVFYNNNSIKIRTDRETLSSGDFILYPAERSDIFSIELNGEKRNYPLPLYIKNTGTDLELYIEEDINQFAIDSAWGELGDVSERNSEALYALAHLIKARCALPYLTNKHQGCHFCDLTCCQTYKGRSRRTFNDPVSIKAENLKNGLFFNSSGGGVIFTESIFNDKVKSAPAPKDIIYQENFILSREKYLNWEATINKKELTEILYPGRNEFLIKITFAPDKEILYIETGRQSLKYAPETFRLIVNRVKGWSFIKSNNYTLTMNDDIYKFKGSGLGHGAGMSFEGALQLAERGYSRYEIIEHYYPEIKYDTPPSYNNQLQYIIFDYKSGETIQSSTGDSFRNRIIPCGSIFKLFIALYLAEKRTDLFYNYSYTCTGDERDKAMPEYCWDKPGHGRMDIRSALYHSCNKYFASLYSRIDRKDFTQWLNTFTAEKGIALSVPGIKDNKDFADLLAGLNFNLTITIYGIIRLNRHIFMENKEGSSERAGIIFSTLHKTFTIGTAKEHDGEKMKNRSYNNFSMQQNIKEKDLWGKTGTVIAGTNSHHGYGIFTGGLKSSGIAAILRKGTGAETAKESKKILLNLK